MRTKRVLKWAAMIILAKKGLDWIQTQRQPKKSPVARVAPVGALVAAGGGLTYLARSGKLGRLTGKRGPEVTRSSQEVGL